eukprot:gene25654-biopygen10745
MFSSGTDRASSGSIGAAKHNVVRRPRRFLPTRSILLSAVNL